MSESSGRAGSVHSVPTDPGAIAADRLDLGAG